MFGSGKYRFSFPFVHPDVVAFSIPFFCCHLLVHLAKTLIFITLGGNEIGSLIEKKQKNKTIVATVAVVCPFLCQSHPPC